MNIKHNKTEKFITQFIITSRDARRTM